MKQKKNKNAKNTHEPMHGRVNLRKHQHLEHDSPLFSKFKCDYCNYIVNYKSHFLRHVRNRHLQNCRNKPTYFIET